jgi:hypothetical protein
MTLKRPVPLILILPAILAVLACTGCASFLSLFSGDKGWMLFDVSRLRDYYYSPSTIERLTPIIVRLHIATVAKGEEGKNWEVSERVKRGLPFGGYENYQSSEDVYLLNCRDRQYRLMSSQDLDSTGKVLSSYDRPDAPWEDIPYGSALETLLTFKSVCP